jgi:hypothetical protein
MNALQEELELYAQREDEFKKTHFGKFVVIKGPEILGFFDDLDSALTEGTRRFGLESYLVRKIGEPIETVTIPALTLGLIGAHS